MSDQFEQGHMEKQEIKQEDDSTQLGDAQSAWVAERLSALMAEHGVPARQQASLLCELCSVSPSQARRKLRGAMWTFGEVFTVVRHFGASLDQLFAGSPDAGVAHVGISTGTFTPALLDATFLMDKFALPCQVCLGSLVIGSPNDDELLTAQNQAGWYVGTRMQLDKHRHNGEFYYVAQVLLTPAPTKPNIRIAILDDDIGTSETLGEWFTAAGYAAMAFTSAEQLLASQVENYDAFVVDFLLAGGDSSQATIKQIRQALPDAPIVLLTGKLRDGQVTEADLTTMLRTANVSFFEKPVRPSVLAATIEKELDQLAHRRAG
jgi:CheY-like chemotaxis protein